MSDGFQIHVDGLDELIARMDDAPTIVGAELLTAMRGVGADTERYGMLLVPVNQGKLKGSIRFAAAKTATGAAVRVMAGGPGVPYARPVEEGRRAGARQPPTAPIADWLRVVGGDPSRAFQVARSIGRRGIRARPYLKPAAERAIRESGRHTKPALARIRARLAR